jgi:hypothetical protein
LKAEEKYDTGKDLQNAQHKLSYKTAGKLVFPWHLFDKYAG